MTEPGPARLTHVDESGAARMVDVSGKDVTARGPPPRPAGCWSRRRSSRCCAARACPRATRSGSPGSPGSWAPSRRPSLIPLCHPLAISGVTVDLAVADDVRRHPRAVRTTDRTGVEMEALTAVSVAALTVVDMVKAVDKARRDHRRAGRDQDRRQVRRLGPVMDDRPRPSSLRRRRRRLQPGGRRGLRRRDRAADRGRSCRSWASTGRAGRRPGRRPGRRRHRGAAAGGARVVLTTGGTGLTPTDRTPEATRPLLDREVPGIAEAIRAAGVAAGRPDRGAVARAGRRRGRLPGGQPARLAGRG